MKLKVLAVPFSTLLHLKLIHIQAVPSTVIRQIRTILSAPRHILLRYPELHEAVPRYLMQTIRCQKAIPIIILQTLII